jgi:Holliday junction resolvasome RuvABC endonuclease subunit
MKVLALDVSSSTIGWASLIKNPDKSIVLDNYGYIKPMNKKQSNDNLSLRLMSTQTELENLIKSESPDEVIIEDYAKRFSKGRSSANTIILLALFNEITALSAYKIINKQAIKHRVSSIRSAVGNAHNIKIKDKDDVIGFVSAEFPSFVIIKNKNNNTKKEVEDEADAIILGYYHLLTMI